MVCGILHFSDLILYDLLMAIEGESRSPSKGHDVSSIACQSPAAISLNVQMHLCSSHPFDKNSRAHESLMIISPEAVG